MSLSRPDNSPSKEKHWIGRDKPKVTIIKDEHMHWTEQLRLKPKDTTPREVYDKGDFSTLMDIDRE